MNISFSKQFREIILFLKNKKRIVVKDSLIGPGRHYIEENFHFYPEVKLKNQKDYVSAESHGQILRLIFPDGDMEIVEGGISPVEGWYAPNYGLKQPAPVLKFKKF